MLGFEFGEQVHFRRIPMQGRLGKLDSLWQEGVYLGFKTQSAEYMIANSEGAFKTRTIKRVPECERWRKDGIEELRWTPWRVKEGHGSRGTIEADQSEHNPFLEVDLDKSIDLPTPAKVVEDAMPRRVYITRATLSKFGMTDGCLGCTASAMGGTGHPHSEACRARIERAMREDPDQRLKLKETQLRRREFIDRHAKKLRTTGEEESAETKDMNAEETPHEGGRKRKADGEPEDEHMEVMHCLCEH